jgi:small-conductance mechanosensitive channel
VRWLETLMDWLSDPLVRGGAWQLTPISLIKLTVLPVLLIVVARVLRRAILNRLLNRSPLDIGLQNAIGTIAYYTITVIGLAIIVSSAGIDLTALAAFTGALGLGIGLGLQDVARNFISGLILLFSRPIKPGDRIDVDGLEANVLQIGVYSTTVVTLDDAAVILPNSLILQNKLVNWSLTGNRRRMKLSVGVGYRSDAAHVKRLLEETVRSSQHVLSDPPPDARLVRFGDSSLEFEVVFWSDSYRQIQNSRVSDLNYAILEAFRKHEIEIPFPQRELHVRSSNLPLPGRGEKTKEPGSPQGEPGSMTR